MVPTPIGKLHDGTQVFFLSVPAGTESEIVERIRVRVNNLMDVLNGADLHDMRVVQVMNRDVLVEVRTKAKQDV